MKKSSSKSGLGRGLSSLIPCDDYAEEEGFSRDHSREVLPLNVLKPGGKQPRKDFCREELESLAESVRSNGIINPIIVRESSSDDSEYEIIAGERRWRAASIAGLKEVPVIIRDVNDKTALEFAIIENVQREDLNAIEEAEAYKKLIDQCLYTHDDLSGIIGKSRSHITNMIRLLSLPVRVQSCLKSGKITMGHARAMINISNIDQILDKIIDKSLSVRQTESFIKKLQKGKEEDKTAVVGDDKKKKGKEVFDLERRLSERLGLGIRIDESGEGGEVRISYKSLSELENLLEKLISV